MARKPRRILVADDEDTSRNALRHQLVDAGYDVCTTTFGSDVILLCDLDPPDVLIMDVHLPDMDGFEVCEYVRHETREFDVTIIIMTEVNDEMTRAYLGQMVEYAGGDYFIANPCDVKLLLTLLDDLTAEEGPVSDRSGAAFPTRVTWPTTARRY